NKAETVKKPTVKYAEMYRRSSKKPTVRGNQRNWNNLKTQQLGLDFAIKKKACYNCGDFNHLAYDCRKRVKRGTSGSQNGALMRPPHRPADHRPHGAPMRPPNRHVGHRLHGPPMRPMRSNMNVMNSYCQKKFSLLEEVPTARVILPLVCTAGEDYSQSMMHSSQSMSILGMYGYNAVTPPAADLYLSPKKDLSWTGLPEFVDDIVTDYKPTDSILSKPAVKFVKAVDRPTERPTINKAETVKKPTIKYAEMYRRSSKKPTVKGNQRNWNNLKTQQLGLDFAMKKKACYNYDLSWTDLPEFADDIVTDYSRPSPTIESTSEDGQNRNSSAFENGEPTDSILSKPVVKFVKAVDRPTERPTINKAETVKKPTVKYAEMYRRSSKKPTVRGNQRNWNNLKTQQLGLDFAMNKTACYNCGEFNHLAYDCRKRVKRGTSGSQNGAPMRPPHRPADHRPHGAPMRPPNRPIGHRPHGPPMRPIRSNMNGARPNRTSFNKQAHLYSKRPFQETTQELMIILIQRVQRLERELKARAHIHKEDRGRSRPIITVNVIPPAHVDDVPVVEPNQHNDVLVIPEPVLVDEEKDPEEDEFEEEDPQEEEDDMEVDIEEYENEPHVPVIIRSDTLLSNEVRSSVEQGTAAMDKLVEKLGNAEDKAECKKLKNKLKEAKFSNTFLHMQNERVERDLYWTRV
nr:ubiquitin hydrolase [Tanacetum cinerariifolium]